MDTTMVMVIAAACACFVSVIASVVLALVANNKHWWPFKETEDPSESPSTVPGGTPALDPSGCPAPGPGGCPAPGPPATGEADKFDQKFVKIQNVFFKNGNCPYSYLGLPRGNEGACGTNSSWVDGTYVGTNKSGWNDGRNAFGNFHLVMEDEKHAEFWQIIKKDSVADKPTYQILSRQRKDCKRTIRAADTSTCKVETWQHAVDLGDEDSTKNSNLWHLEPTGNGTYRMKNVNPLTDCSKHFLNAKALNTKVTEGTPYGKGNKFFSGQNIDEARTLRWEKTDCRASWVTTAGGQMSSGDETSIVELDVGTDTHSEWIITIQA